MNAILLHAAQTITRRSNNMAKSDYHDDPEQYWRDKEERELSDAKERIERWERQNPNHVYGQREPQPPKDYE